MKGLVHTRLKTLATIGPEVDALVHGLGGLQTHAAGSQLVHDREPLVPRLLVSGWAARVRWLADGRRQIIGFIIAGDAIGICERPQPLALAPVLALTTVQTLDGRAMQAALVSGDRPPGLAEAFHMAASLDEAALIDQVVRLGRQTAYERIGHLLLELRYRHQQVGLGTETDFPCPLTQEMIADATGLSVVHVNRTLQQLRRDELLELRQGYARLLQTELLEAITDWRPPQPSADDPRCAPARGPG